jgi:TRAP-type mannitol/chloroaromatic compound transport system permease small subunit
MPPANTLQSGAFTTTIIAPASNMLPLLKRITTIIDAAGEYLGRAIAWLTLAMAVLTFTVVIMRYFLGAGSIALQESVTYLHALVFLLGAGYTLKHDGHVRVDIFYQRLSERGQAGVNLLGGLLFLMPVCLLILLTCWDYVAASWAIRETSDETSGLPFVYLLKSLLILMPLTLLLQAIAETARNLLVLMGANHLESHPERGLL